jgi:hypothetical protein
VTAVGSGAVSTLVMCTVPPPDVLDVDEDELDDEDPGCSIGG